MHANGWRLLAALLWIIAANTLVVWWFAGDIEMGWILAMILVPMAGLVIGAIGEVILAGSLGGLLGSIFGALFRTTPRSTRPGGRTGLLPGTLRLLSPLTLSPALAVLFLAVAIKTTPYARPLEPSAALRAAADALATDRATLQAEARRITGIPVEIGEPDVVVNPGRLLKEGFRLRLTRFEPAATVSFTFAAGPRRRMTFDVIPGDDGWRTLPRDPELFAAHPDIELTRAYLERRFPGREATLDADWPDYTRGDTVLILLRGVGEDRGSVMTRSTASSAGGGAAPSVARVAASGAVWDTVTSVVGGAAPVVTRAAASADGRVAASSVIRDAPSSDDRDWALVLFRLGEGDEMLREVRRYSGDEIVAHFTRAASAAGLGRLHSLRFQRPPNRLQDPSFGFLGELDGGPRRMAWFAAIRRGDGVEFMVAER